MKGYMLIQIDANGASHIMAQGLGSFEECERVWNERVAFGGRGIISDAKGTIVGTINYGDD